MMTASDVVKNLISKQSGLWSPVFDILPTDYMKSYFSVGFNSDWTKALALINQYSIMDGDPISGYNSVTNILLNSLTVTASTSTTSTINASINLVIPNATTAQFDTTVTFYLIVESYNWVIDDYNYNLQAYNNNFQLYNLPTVRKYLQSFFN